MRKANSTWSIMSWSSPLNKRKRKRSPESPQVPQRRPSLAETISNGINNVDLKGRSLLFYAARFDQPEVAVQLLAAGCYPNVADYHGDSPLHEAAENGHLEVAQMLVGDERCNIDSVNVLGQTPLMKAIANDNLEIVKILVKSGCNKNTVDTMGRSALIIGLQEGSEKSCMYLLKSGCDVNIAAVDGCTPFFYATHSTGLTTLSLAKKLIQMDYDLKNDISWLSDSKVRDSSLLKSDKRFYKSILSKVDFNLTNINEKTEGTDFFSKLKHAFRSSPKRSFSSSSTKSSKSSVSSTSSQSSWNSSFDSETSEHL